MPVDEIDHVLSVMTLNDPASESAIANFEREAGFQLPSAHRELLLRSNGLEGFLGENHYLFLWPVEELLEHYHGYLFSEYAPYLFPIGSNGGDAAYAFDTRDDGLPVVEIPYLDLGYGEPIPAGNSFVDFLKNLRED